MMKVMKIVIVQSQPKIKTRLSENKQDKEQDLIVVMFILFFVLQSLVSSCFNFFSIQKIKTRLNGNKQDKEQDLNLDFIHHIVFTVAPENNNYIL